jgi:phospholipid/cholesterol/gamma-HCH transport system permease protein
MLTLVRTQSIRVLEMIGEYVSLVLDVFSSIFRELPPWKLVREQLYHIGVMSFSVVAITGFTTGFVLAAQSELGPILTAFMVTGRIGSAMCAELATMKVTEQIDALRSMAINPNSYLVAPRFIAGILMIPLLTLFSALMGILGGYLIAISLFHISAASYFDPMRVHITLFDLVTCGVKSFIFGILLVTVCCYKGMKASGGAAGVGKSTTQSVVTSYVLILISDFFLTMALNVIHKQIRYGMLP